MVEGQLVLTTARNRTQQETIRLSTRHKAEAAQVTLVLAGLQTY